jgi:hypothetical protein
MSTAGLPIEDGPSRAAAGEGGGAGGGLETLNRGAGGLPPDDREAVARFVRELRDLMVSVLERPVLLAPYNNRLREAWVTINPVFETFARAIEDLPEDETAFASHGLTGAELKVKLDVFEAASAAFYYEARRLDRGPLRLLRAAPLVPMAEPPEQEALPSVLDKPAGRFRRLRTGPVRSAARTALAFGDKVLQSVTGALAVTHPAAGAAGPAVDELKGVVETVLGGMKRWFKGR